MGPRAGLDGCRKFGPTGIFFFKLHIFIAFFRYTCCLHGFECHSVLCRPYFINQVASVSYFTCPRLNNIVLEIN